MGRFGSKRVYTLPILVWNRVWFSWELRECMNVVLVSIGHLHDGVILQLRPESFGFLLSCVDYGFFYLNLGGITKFKCKRKHKKNSGRIQ